MPWSERSHCLGGGYADGVKPEDIVIRMRSLYLQSDSRLPTARSSR